MVNVDKGTADYEDLIHHRTIKDKFDVELNTEYVLLENTLKVGIRRYI